MKNLLAALTEGRLSGALVWFSRKALANKYILVFGPRVRSHAHDLPKKVRALALRHALSSKAGSSNLIIIDDAALKAPKTKDLRSSFANLGVQNALVISGETVDENFALAARNIPCVDVLPAQGLNVYDVLRRDTLVLTKAAVEKIHARLSAKEA